MKRALLTVCLALLAVVSRADEVTDLKVALAIAEVRAQRLEGLLQAQVVDADPSVLPEVPDLTPAPVRQQPQYVTQRVTRYKEFRVKHCNGRRCWYTTERRPYVTTERVLITNSFNAADDGTPFESVKRILEHLWSSSPKTLLDLGSGDGRVVVNWAVYTGYPAIGIESDPARVAASRAFAARKGVSHLVTIIEGDFTKIAWPAADAIYLYQFPDILAEVSGRLKNAKQVVSFSHEVSGLAMRSHNGGEFYSWTRPQQITQQRAPQQRVAYWYGKAYTAPVCNKRGCTMCASIRAQLGM